MNKIKRTTTVLFYLEISQTQPNKSNLLHFQQLMMYWSIIIYLEPHLSLAPTPALRDKNQRETFITKLFWLVFRCCILRDAFAIEKYKCRLGTTYKLGWKETIIKFIPARYWTYPKSNTIYFYCPFIFYGWRTDYYYRWCAGWWYVAKSSLLQESFKQTFLSNIASKIFSAQ